MPAAAPGRLVLPTPDGDYVTVENKEGVKTISDKGQEIEIRKLSPAERARRRRVKNIIMFTFAVVLLVVVVVIMTRK
jgi:predicted nucleic acid-binding Zn ribbon protein